MILMIQILVATILARYSSAAECSSSQNKFDSEKLNTTTSEGWHCETVSTDCSIVTTIHYSVPGKEFSIIFNCNVPPIKNAHSDAVFRKVTSYRLNGRAACSAAGFGLEYLSFAEKINQLVLEGYCLPTLANGTFKSFHNLKQLELTECKIRHALSDGFRYLPVLQKLVIEKSVFKTMDHDVLFSLVQLKELIIHHCMGIDLKVSALANIELFDMRNSTVHNISSIFDHLPEMLKEINIENISSQNNSKLILEPSDEGQSAVQHITVVQCSLNSIAVRNMPLLVSLYLSRNSLSESSVELVNLYGLVTLVLSRNEFKAVLQSLVQFKSSLGTIDLSHNRVSYVHPKAFELAQSLRLVNLSYNQLLNMENFQPNLRLDRIEIDSNPWDCSWLNHCLLVNPTLFNIFRYNKRYDVLSVWGLPCLLQMSATDSEFSLQFDPKQNVPAKPEPFVSYPEGKILPLGHKISIYQPRFTIANPLKVIISISVGVLVSNVIILLYNRYRNMLHEPFYRYLSKSLSAGDAVTEKSTSFWYEVPVRDEANTIPLNNIYEEISEAGPHRDIYDALNFQRDEPEEQLLSVIIPS